MEKYRILYLADNPTAFEMVKALLESENILDDITWVNEKGVLFREIKQRKYDLILADFNLSNINGLELMRLLEKNKNPIPVIILTETLNEEIAAEVIKKGAYDYVLLPYIYKLPEAIRNAMRRKKMEDDRNLALIRLKESEENYRILAEASPYGIIVHNKGKLVYYNKQAIRILNGDIKANYKGRQILDFVHPEFHEIVKERMKNLYKGKNYLKFFQLILINFHSELIQVELAAASIIFNGVPSAQVIFSDISERKKMEGELIRAKLKAEESDRLKTAFLENMSHEIRTPLNGIIGFSTLLKHKVINEEDRIKYLEIIEQSGKHLLNIINDLIEISRIESGHIDIRREIFNLNDLMDDLYIFFTKSVQMKGLPINLSLIKSISDDNAFINTDASRLKQVLINLLNNALKFTLKGQISFGYEQKDNKTILFFVKDTGIGIPDNAKEFVFERFRQADDAKTREYGGAGLGLTISKGLVDILGGKIWFDSIYEKGTTFNFTLPGLLLSNVLAGTQNSGEDQEEIDWRDKHILIAEDEHSNVILLRHILKPTGIKIERVSTGIEVLNKLQNGTHKYDLILMDIKMPEMDGLETIKKIRKKNIKISIIAQTAYAMTDDRQKCINAGFDEYITKPIRANELLKLMAKFIK